MIQRKIHLLALLLSLFISAIAKEKPISLKGQIKGYTDSTIVFTYQPYELLAKLKREEVKIDAHGNFKLTVHEASPIRGFFSLGKKTVLEQVQFTKPDGQDTSMSMSTVDPRLIYVYMAPGDKLEVQVDTADYRNSMKFTGKHKDESYLLNIMDWNFNSYKDRYLNNYYVNVGYDPDQLNIYADNMAQKKYQFINEYTAKHRIRKHLSEVLLLEAYYTSSSLRINYPALRKQYLKDDPWTPPTEYFSFLDDISLPIHIRNKGIGYYYFLDNYLKTKHRLQMPAEEYYSWIERELNGYELYEYLAFALGRDFKKAIYDRFGKNCPYPDLALLVNERYESMLGMLEGSPAPVLVLEDTIGNKIDLQSFRGRYVYIDCWATWCGPCIKEIPALQELEKLFPQEEIAFLSLSFDSPKDKEKWKTFVRDYPLHGHQYWLDAEQKKKLSLAFNIQEIPRFILIDPDGNVIDANALRPSDPKIRDLIKGLLNNASQGKEIAHMDIVADSLCLEPQELLVLGENHSSSAASQVVVPLLFKWQEEEETLHFFLEFGPSEAYFYQRYLDTGDEKMLNYPLYSAYYEDWRKAWKLLRNEALKQKKEIVIHGVDFDRCRTFGYTIYHLLNKQPDLPNALSTLCDTVRSKDFFRNYTIDFPTKKDSLFIAYGKKTIAENFDWLEEALSIDDIAVVKAMLDAPQPVSRDGRDRELAERVSLLVKESSARRPFLLIGRQHGFTRVPYLPERKSAVAIMKEQGAIPVRNLVILYEESDQWNSTYDEPITIFDVSQKQPWKSYATALLNIARANPFSVIPMNCRFQALKEYADYILIAQKQPAIRIRRN